MSAAQVPGNVQCQRQYVDRAGQAIGRSMVLRIAGSSDSRVAWTIRCECGAEFARGSNDVTNAIREGRALRCDPCVKASRRANALRLCTAPHISIPAPLPGSSAPLLTPPRPAPCNPDVPGELPEPSYDALRSRRAHAARARTLSPRELERDVRRHLTLLPPIETQRPRTRADCVDGERPCPYVSCKHHLYLEVDGGSIKLNFPDLEPEALQDSCSLDLAADKQGHSAARVGRALNLTRERVRQLEKGAIAKARATAKRMR